MTTNETSQKARPGSSYKSVRDLAKGLTDSPEVLENFDEKQEKTRLVRTLISMRVKAGLTQSELAEKMECTQSRVSKLENSEDDNISIQDVAEYSEGTGYRITLDFGPPTTLVEKVKCDAMKMKDSLNKLAEIAKRNEEDPKLLGNIQAFFSEATWNLAMILNETASKVPCVKEDGEGEEKGSDFLVFSGADSEGVCS